MTSTFGTSATTVLASSMRFSSGNSGALPGFAAIATTTLSKMRLARRTRSLWPFVNGSKVPGYIARLPMRAPSFVACFDVMAAPRAAPDDSRRRPARLLRRSVQPGGSAAHRARRRPPGRSRRPARASRPAPSAAQACASQRSSYGGSTNTTSNGSRRGCARKPKASRARRGRGRIERREHVAMRRRRARVALHEHDLARRRATTPRSPSAPLPANRSRQRLPRDLELQPVEQRFADPVRRRAQPPDCGKCSLRPRHSPPMMRTSPRPPGSRVAAMSTRSGPEAFVASAKRSVTHASLRLLRGINGRA